MVLAQKVLIAKCNLLGKPVVTATQRLESFTRLPRPASAETSVGASTVPDDTDCVMLSGETAGGEFPFEEVTILRRICKEVEAVIDYESLFLGMRMNTLENFTTTSAVESVCSAAVKATIGSSCPLIIVRQLHPAAPVRPGDDGHRHCFLLRRALWLPLAPT